MRAPSRCIFNIAARAPQLLGPRAHIYFFSARSVAPLLFHFRGERGDGFSVCYWFSSTLFARLGSRYLWSVSANSERESELNAHFRARLCVLCVCVHACPAGNIYMYDRRCVYIYGKQRLCFYLRRRECFCARHHLQLDKYNGRVQSMEIIAENKTLM